MAIDRSDRQFEGNAKMHPPVHATAFKPAGPIKRVLVVLLTATAMLLGSAYIAGAATSPSLGAAASFAVLAGSTVTNANATTLCGDVGVSPGSAVTGEASITFLCSGSHRSIPDSLIAQNAVIAAQTSLTAQGCTATNTSLTGATTLVAGVYCYTSGASVGGTLTLDGQGDPNAVFIFKTVSTLTTATTSTVRVINGAQECNVWWQIGSSADLFTNTTFVGNILADQSINLQSGTSLHGRALAQHAAVTMDHNVVTRSTCAAATTLTLHKTVNNTAGGSAVATDWTLTASGTTTFSGTSGSGTVTTVPVVPGTYLLTESGSPSGYPAGTWSCTGNGALTQPNSLLLTAGDTAVCTITNTFSASPAPTHLTLVKAVVGGTAVATDWMLNASGTPSFSGTSGSPAVTNVVVGAGTFLLTESGGPAGYPPGTWSCNAGTLTQPNSLLLAAGDDATCTVTNTFVPAVVPTHLTLVKTVGNAGGGTAVAIDWTLNASGPTPFSGTSGTGLVTNVLVTPGTYLLTESGGPSGYSAGNWSCTAGTLTGNSLLLAAGQSASCTIHNTFVPVVVPTHLTLVKVVSGGTAVAIDWTLNAAGPTSFSGTSGSGLVTNVLVTPGTYLLTESGGPSGYSPSIWSCTAGTLTGNSLLLAVGQSATCTITNTFVPVFVPTHLTLVKVVVGGTAVPTNWMLNAAGPTSFSGTSGSGLVTAVLVGPGTYTLTESGGPAGYPPGSWLCTDGTLVGNILTLAVGDNATCTITNTFVPVFVPTHLTLVKTVSGGTGTAIDWTLNASGPTPFFGISGTGIVTNVLVGPGVYTLTESGGPAGYSPGTWACTDGTLVGNVLTLVTGDNATCTIHNTFVPVFVATHLTLTKIVVGGTAIATAWTLSATGPTSISGASGTPAVTSVLVGPGTYTLIESGGPAGYSPGAWSCSGGSINGNILTLVTGDTATCTITNTFVPAFVPTRLTLVKIVVGGTAVATEWTLSASGPTSIAGASGTAAVTDALVGPGTYTLVESGPGGFSPSAWSCTGGSLVDNVLTLVVGDTATCTITNTSQVVTPPVTTTEELPASPGGSSPLVPIGLLFLIALSVSMVYIDRGVRSRAPRR